MSKCKTEEAQDTTGKTNKQTKNTEGNVPEEEP